MDQIIRNQLRDSLWAFANASDNFSNFLELKFICFAYVMNELFSIHQLNDCWPSKQLKLIYLSFVEIWLVSQRLELWLISTVAVTLSSHWKLSVNFKNVRFIIQILSVWGSIFELFFCKKKYLLVGASGMLWTGQWMSEWVSEWVSERCMYVTPIRLDLL